MGERQRKREEKNRSSLFQLIQFSWLKVIHCQVDVFGENFWSRKFSTEKLFLFFLILDGLAIKDNLFLDSLPVDCFVPSFATILSKSQKSLSEDYLRIFSAPLIQWLGSACDAIDDRWLPDQLDQITDHPVIESLFHCFLILKRTIGLILIRKKFAALIWWLNLRIFQSWENPNPHEYLILSLSLFILSLFALSGSHSFLTWNSILTITNSFVPGRIISHMTHFSSCLDNGFLSWEKYLSLSLSFSIFVSNTKERQEDETSFSSSRLFPSFHFSWIVNLPLKHFFCNQDVADFLSCLTIFFFSTILSFHSAKFSSQNLSFRFSSLKRNMRKKEEERERERKKRKREGMCDDQIVSGKWHFTWS